MNDADFPVADVLRGIDAAERAGLGPIKVNMVVKRGTNDQRDPADGAPLPRPRRRAALHRVHGRRRDQRLAHGRGAAVGRGRRAHRATSSRSSRSPPSAPGETAERWRYADGVAGEIGMISSVTQAFCSDCNRARLSTEGKLFLCLFASRGHDLRALLRGGASDAEIAAAIGLIWQERDDRYSELRSAAPARRASRRAARRDALHRRVSDSRRDPPARRGRPRRLQAAARRDARAHPRSVHLRRRERARARSRPTTCTGSASSAATAASSCSAPGAASACSARSAASATTRLKVRHIGHVIGMMVRPEARGRGLGALLLEACIAEARHAGLEMLTLTVTAGNAGAVRLYERHGFVAYGTLRRAIKVGGRYHDKLHMALVL